MCVRVRGGATLAHISCMSLPDALVQQHIMLSTVSHILAVLMFLLPQHVFILLSRLSRLFS